MPFGSFMAQRKDPRPKKERPQKEKKPVIPAAPKEEKMVFHDLNSDSQKLKILLVGRTLSQIREFLCSVSENMSKELHQDGLAYYTTELSSISDVVDKKKKLERFFWEYSKKDWTCPEDPEDYRVYTFSISPSGVQDKTLDLVFHCCTSGSDGVISQEQADAVWYLADGPVLDAGIGYDDYRAFLQDAIGSLRASEDGVCKPVCLILSHVETFGHFGGMGELCMLKSPVRDRLIGLCRDMFSCDDHVAVAVIPVQVYGGLEYVGTDGDGKPVLRLSGSGYYQSYIPENCQIPGLYTIGKLAENRGTDFFAGSSCGGMKKVVRRQFARKKGELDWKPDSLREVTEV